MYERKIPREFDCGMAVIMEVIGGKWKSYLIYCIAHGKRRPSELQRAIPSATLRVLNQQLRELEEHGIIRRMIHAQVPPKVEYFLTEYGESLMPVINAMDNWGNVYMAKYAAFLQKNKVAATRNVVTHQN